MTYTERKEKARQEAIDFQVECSRRYMSYSECLDADIHFTKIGKRYGLLKEFKENGII